MFRAISDSPVHVVTTTLIRRIRSQGFPRCINGMGLKKNRRGLESTTIQPCYYSLGQETDRVMEEESRQKAYSKASTCLCSIRLQPDRRKLCIRIRSRPLVDLRLCSERCRALAPIDVLPRVSRHFKRTSCALILFRRCSFCDITRVVRNLESLVYGYLARSKWRGG